MHMLLAMHLAYLGQLCDGRAGRYTRNSLHPDVVLKLQQESDRMKGVRTGQVWPNAQLMPVTCLHCAKYGADVSALCVHQANKRKRTLEFAESATTEPEPNVRQRASAHGQEQLAADIAQLVHANALSGEPKHNRRNNQRTYTRPTDL